MKKKRSVNKKLKKKRSVNKKFSEILSFTK